MKKTGIYRIIIIVLLILFLGVSFSIYNKIFHLQQLLPTGNLDNHLYSSALLYCILSIIIGLLIFAFAFIVSQSKTIISKTTTATDNNTSEIPKDISKHINSDDTEDVNLEEITQILTNELNEQYSINEFAEKFLSNISHYCNIVQGIFFMQNFKTKNFYMLGSYAFFTDKEVREFKYGEGLSGQVAKNKKILNVPNVPENYITILSGLGSSSPNYLLLFPIIYKEESIAVIEIASFKEFPTNIDTILSSINDNIAEKLISFINQE